MDGFRNWLMGLIAGRKFAYWIREDKQRDIDAIGKTGILGGGAAICLVDAVKRNNGTKATFTLSDFTVTVERKESAE